MYHYDDEVPTIHYLHFAARAGCHDGKLISDSAIFDCLVNADTETLQYASANVSVSGSWGTWAFQPVIDGDFIQELPTTQLLKTKVSGKRILSGVSSTITINMNWALKANFPRTMPMMACP
jgi:hypothetical protein